MKATKALCLKDLFMSINEKSYTKGKYYNILNNYGTSAMIEDDQKSKNHSVSKGVWMDSFLIPETLEEWIKFNEGITD